MSNATILAHADALADPTLNGLFDSTDDELVDRTVNGLVDSTDGEFVDQTTGGVGTTPGKSCSRQRSRNNGRGHSGGEKLTIPSISGAAVLNPLECVEKGLCLARGEVKPITGDVNPMISNHRPGKVEAPGAWRSRLRDFTRIDYA